MTFEHLGIIHSVNGALWYLQVRFLLLVQIDRDVKSPHGGAEDKIGPRMPIREEDGMKRTSLLLLLVTLLLGGCGGGGGDTDTASAPTVTCSCPTCSGQALLDAKIEGCS
jgi:hypothetical protein